MRSWIWSGVWAAALALGHARAATLQLEVAGAGEVFTQDVGDAKLLPGNLAGVTGVTSPVMIHPGHRIDGAYCHGFGFSFRALNLAPGDHVPITIQVTHPKWTLPDGRTGTEESWVSVLDSGRWGYVGYSFTEPWSLEPGTWVFSVSEGSRLLTQQSFEVDVAPGQAMPLQGCVSAVS